MKHLFCYRIMPGMMLFGMAMLGMTILGMTMLATQARAQTDSLTDEDIIAIKTMAEHRLSDYQDIMNRLITPDLLSVVRLSIIKDGLALFTENARLEVDYDTTYFPPNMAYEVEIQKYLGDFATYHGQMHRVVYTDRIISDIAWKSPENFYYLTINFTSVYDDLPPQRRVATLTARREGDQWQTLITYVKFKASPGSPLAFIDTKDEVQSAEDTANIPSVPANGQPVVQKKNELQNQILLNNLASGGKRGKRYLIGWRMPQGDTVSVQLLSHGDAVKTIITGQQVDILQWTIATTTKPGKYQLRVTDERSMASITSPAFKISRRFPMALRVGLGVAAGFYIVQTARNGWNFGWPFSNGGSPEVPQQEFPELPKPPDLPE